MACGKQSIEVELVVIALHNAFIASVMVFGLTSVAKNGRIRSVVFDGITP